MAMLPFLRLSDAGEAQCEHAARNDEQEHPLASAALISRHSSPPAPSLALCTVVLLISELMWAFGLLLEAAWQSGYSDDDNDELRAFSVGETVATWAACGAPALRVAVVRVGVALGAKDMRSIRTEAKMTRIFSWALGVLLTLVAAAMAQPLITEVYQLHSAASIALSYTLIHLIGNLFLYVFYANSYLLQGMQHVKVYATITGLKTACMLLSNWLAVMHLHGGPIGSGIASASRNTLLALASGVYLRYCVPPISQVRVAARTSSASSSPASVPPSSPWPEPAASANHIVQARGGRRSRRLHVLRSTTSSLPPPLTAPTPTPPTFASPWGSFLVESLKLLLASLPSVLTEMVAAAIASRGGHAGADVILRRMMGVPAAVESALLAAALVVGSRLRGEGNGDAQLRYMSTILLTALALGILLGLAFYPLRHPAFAAFSPSKEALDILHSDAVGLVVTATCIVGPLASAAQGIAYATRRFGAVALVNWIGLGLFAPAIALVARYAPDSLAATRAAYLVNSTASMLGCFVLTYKERLVLHRGAAVDLPPSLLADSGVVTLPTDR